ncbi:hypothetical protein [Ornithinibacillus halophilus]|uniref:Uncharacterized protein n=1 Tax=Ornithinibacillus halophilus TaxID=930117 RepID=A0A1M5IIA9_9BACI|nr:hypothetical protein [Ornithinibacillus halophilus]SHG28088.1 hypothetical protein SAMN05216225_102431 [Ornithinibacillus halophilus]
MSDLNAKQEGIAIKVEELEEKHNDQEKQIETKTDKNDVHVLIDERLKEEQVVTKADLEKLEERMEANLHASQMKLLKWIIGTGISFISGAIAIIELFIR